MGGLPWWLSGREPACNAGDREDSSLIPGSIRSPGEGNGYPLQYSFLESLVDRGDWKSTLHGVAKSQIVTKPQQLELSYERF